MNDIALKDLKPQLYFTKFLYLDEGYVLLAPETPVTQELVNRLTKWEFRELKSDGTAVESVMASVEGSQEKTAAESPLQTDNLASETKIDVVLAFYRNISEYIDALYTNIVTQNQIDYRELLEKAKGIYEFTMENRRLVLRALAMAPPHKNYLVSHSVRSSVLSIVLGSALKFPIFRIIELGAAAILHEIGMIRLPPQIYMADRKLSPQERKSIIAHPVLGFNLLKEKQVPLAVCLAALEHHERMNGTGYPRGLAGDKISQYSRIIMVACSYDAVTAHRPYKEAKDGYTGMVDILKNDGKQYDETVIRALVYSLSIYPVGSQVLLTNGKKAFVVDVNPDNPRYPVVQLQGVKTPDGKDVSFLTSETGLRILRPLTKDEIAAKENG